MSLDLVFRWFPKTKPEFEFKFQPLTPMMRLIVVQMHLFKLASNWVSFDSFYSKIYP